MSKYKWMKVFSVLLILALTITIAGCGDKSETGKQASSEKPTLILADPQWDSAQLHNYVAAKIIEEGFGYKTDVMVGNTPMTISGLINGDIDIYMELWTTNSGDTYYEAIEKGDIVELGINFDDNAQGLYVPTYMIKGDSERGIEPMAPDLKSIKDLPKYWELFKDPEDPVKGRIFGAIPGWDADKFMSTKWENYGLKENYNYFSPGSDAALATSMATAYEKGEPWVGYYWAPTWVLGLYDMTLLEDEPYSDELWNDNYSCEVPAVPCAIAVNKNMPEKAPEVAEFLKNYKTTSAQISEALAFMQKNEVGADEAAIWFLKEKQDIWTKWVTEDVAKKVKESLQ